MVTDVAGHRGIGVAAAAAFAGGFLLLYAEVLRALVRDWATDENYSHGFLIVPLAGYFVWHGRRHLAGIAVRPRASGLVLVAAGVALLFAGRLGAELFVARFSMLPVLAGSVVFVFGWRFLAALAFPLAFLLLMIPIPATLFYDIAGPLQILASRLGVAVMSALSIPALREGNVIVLANASLNVVEACSGIRSLISLLTVGIVYGYFADSRPVVRALLAALMVPVAIVTKGARVAATAIATHYYGLPAAEGFFHPFGGWLAAAGALAVLFIAAPALKAIADRRAPRRHRASRVR